MHIFIKMINKLIEKIEESKITDLICGGLLKMDLAYDRFHNWLDEKNGEAYPTSTFFYLNEPYLDD